MKKSVLLLLIAICIILGSCTNKTYSSGNPSEILSSDVYNKLQNKYQDIQNYDNGTAIVKNKRFGLIDEKGDEVLPCEYDSITEVYDSYRIIKKNKKYGFVNLDGELKGDCKYNDFYHWRNYVRMKPTSYIPLELNNKWGFLNIEGEPVTQFKYENFSQIDDSFFVAKYNGFYGVSDYEGKVIIPFKYQDIEYRPFSDCKISFVKQNNMYGVVNSKNKLVTDCEYSFYLVPQNGYLRLRKGDSDNYKTTQYGLIDPETGKEVIPFGKYSDIGEYSEGLIMVEKNNKCAYVDINQKIVIPFKYSNGGDFSEGLVLVHKQVGFANTVMGNVPLKKGGYIDKKGNVIIPFKFSEVIGPSNSGFKEGLAVEGYGYHNIWATKLGYINKKGEFVIPPIYDDAEPFENGLGKVKLNDKIGYVNKKGDLVIPCIYNDDYVVTKSDSIIGLSKDGVDYYFDYKGNKTENK